MGTLKCGFLLFWAGWFTLVLATNVCDGLKALGVLPVGWVFASGNFAFIGSVTAKFAVPAAVNSLFFLLVVLWQAAAAGLLWIAFARAISDERPDWAPATTAFAVSLALWAAFIMADELFVAFETGVEGVHLRLFTAQLASLLAIHLLPDDRANTPGGAP